MAAIERTHADLGGRYRPLSEKAGVAYRSLMRWRDRQRQGLPPLSRPGPQKVAPLDLAELLPQLMSLAHGRHRTAGTGELYQRFQDQVSRRILGELIAALRREYFHQQAACQRRIDWQAPGWIWSVDDMELGLQELGLTGVGVNKLSWNQIRDLSSRHQFPPLVTITLAEGAVVAARLAELFEAYGAPLFLKRDNHGNLNNAAVDAVLAQYGVIPLNSPPHYPPYNGGMEEAQGEFKSAIRAKFRDRSWQARGPAETCDLLQLYSELVAHDLDHRRRPCLSGATACANFEVGKRKGRHYDDRRERREVFEEIQAMAALALAETGLTDQRAAGAAWRLAVETWLRREGLITVSVSGKVLPLFE